MKKRIERETTERDPNAKKVVVVNRKARHEYAIMDTYEAGIELVGTEVKSIRAGHANIADAFARLDRGEVWLQNMHILPYEHGTHWNVEARRPRRLLLHRKEIDDISRSLEQKGLTLVPLALFFQHGYAKLELGLGKGKKLYDKREDIANRDVEREMRREAASHD